MSPSKSEQSSPRNYRKNIEKSWSPVLKSTEKLRDKIKVDRGLLKKKFFTTNL
jgi:hypothetical protein